MEAIKQYLNKVFKKPPRRPATAGHLVALSGAILIHTQDGNVVITPQLARDMAKQIPQLANQAESETVQYQIN